MDQIALDYLASRLGGSLDRDGLRVDSLRGIVFATNPEEFQELCMAFGVRELRFVGSSLFFYVTPPENSCYEPKSLAIKLIGSKAGDFLENYGGYYPLKPLRKQ